MARTGRVVVPARGGEVGRALAGLVDVEAVLAGREVGGADLDEDAVRPLGQRDLAARLAVGADEVGDGDVRRLGGERHEGGDAGGGDQSRESHGVSSGCVSS